MVRERDAGYADLPVELILPPRVTEIKNREYCSFVLKNAFMGVFLLTPMTFLCIIVIEVRKVEKRFFFFKTYCPMLDREVDMDRCDTCRHSGDIDMKGLFVECEWGDKDGLGN